MIITSKTPSLDLHGEIESMVEALVLTFIKDNIKMKNEVVLIVHGNGKHIVKNEVHRVLSEHKDVKSFRLDNWNLGQTIVELKIGK